jgi:peptidyl-prolyl cis-trans isomerase SurA
MRKRLVAPIAALLLAGPAGGEEIIDGIAAQVGGDIVLVSDVNQLMAPLEADMRAAGAPEAEIEKMRATILDRLIERRLIQQVVRRAELEATEVEVDSTLASIAEENGLEPDELRESVESQGLSYETYRERIRAEIEQAKVINGMVGSQVRVEEEEVRELYQERLGDQPTGGEEVHLRHLVVGFADDSSAARRSACAATRKALARVRSGESFDAVAREVSQANPARGGDIGWVHLDSLAPWMEPVVESLAPGETSDVIETPFGCNLLKLEERRGYQPITYEQARPVLYQEIFDLRMHEEYTSFMERLREQTFVERRGTFTETTRAPSGTEAGSVPAKAGGP